MYTNDATFLSAINAQSRKIETKLLVGTVEVPLISVEFNDIRERIIGSFSAKTIKATYDINDFGGSLLNEEISLYVMVSGSPLEVLIGKFYVDFEDITYDEIKSTITFMAYDKAVSFQKQIQALEFPITETELLDNIETAIDITIDRTHVTDETFPSLNIEENQEYTYRDLVMDYATYKGLSAHISREGVLIFKNPFRTTVDATIDGESYTDLKLNKNPMIIDSVAFEYDSVTDPVWYNVSGVAGEFTNQVTIKDNPLMSLLERVDLERVVENIFDKMIEFNPTVGFEYHTFESNQFIGPHYDSMDVIEILDKEDESYRSIAHSITWTWNGGMKGTMTGIFAEEAKSDQKLSGTDRDVKSMGIKVDRVEGQIVAFAQTIETIDDITNELSNKLTMTESELEVEIINREKMGEDIIDQLTAKIQFEVDGLNLSFGEIQEQIEEGQLSLTEINTYFDFSAEGLVIGKSDSPLKIQIDNEEISFLQGGTPVAYINGSTLYIKQSTILDAITMANHIIEKSPFTEGRTLFRRI